MIDLFQMLGIEYREDKYTYCLLKMIECGDDAFRKKVGQYFGFSDGGYSYVRRTFTGIDSNTRKQITPDFILYNKTRIAIVESKMFACEGNQQTLDYGNNAESIKKSLGIDEADVALYFMTLSGIKSEHQSFQPLKWNDFYEGILTDTEFEDECLEVVRKTILVQAEKYRFFEKGINDNPYCELFDTDQYWVSPFSLLSSGAYDEIWQEVSGDEPFIVWNSEINGSGHSSFCTSLYKKSWKKEGTGKIDNINLFIRIEWDYPCPVVWLSWEYFNRESEEYVRINSIMDDELKDGLVKSLIDYKDVWEKPHLSFPINTTGKKYNSIKALKCKLPTDGKTISIVLEDMKTVIGYYAKEIDRIQSAIITGKFLYFDKMLYLKNRNP